MLQGRFKVVMALQRFEFGILERLRLKKVFFSLWALQLHFMLVNDIMKLQKLAEEAINKIGKPTVKIHWKILEHPLCTSIIYVESKLDNPIYVNSMPWGLGRVSTYDLTCWWNDVAFSSFLPTPFPPPPPIESLRILSISPRSRPKAMKLFTNIHEIFILIIRIFSPPLQPCLQHPKKAQKTADKALQSKFKSTPWKLYSKILSLLFMK